MDGQLFPSIISCLIFDSPSDEVNKPSLFYCETRPCLSGPQFNPWDVLLLNFLDVPFG